MAEEEPEPKRRPNGSGVTGWQFLARLCVICTIAVLIGCWERVTGGENKYGKFWCWAAATTIAIAVELVFGFFRSRIANRARKKNEPSLNAEDKDRVAQQKSTSAP